MCGPAQPDESAEALSSDFWVDVLGVHVENRCLKKSCCSSHEHGALEVVCFAQGELLASKVAKGCDEGASGDFSLNWVVEQE